MRGAFSSLTAHQNLARKIGTGKLIATFFLFLMIRAQIVSVGPAESLAHASGSDLRRAGGLLLALAVAIG